MKRLSVVLLLVLIAVTTLAAKRRMPSGAECLRATGFDSNQDNVKDPCPPTDAWVATGSDYVADFNDGQFISPIVLITPEAESPTNDFVLLPTGSAQLPVSVIMLCKQSWTAGDYFLSFYAATPNNADPYLFYSWDTPVVPQPNPSDGMILNNGQSTFKYLTTAANRVGSAQDFQLHVVGGPNFTDNLKVTVTNAPHCLYVAPGPGVRLSRAALTSATSQPPNPASFDVKKVTTDYPTSCTDDRFGGANQVSWDGYSNRGQSTLDPDLRLLWGVDTSVAYLYACMTVGDGNLQGTVTTDNSATIDSGSDDYFMMGWRQGISTAAFDASTWKFIGSAAGGRALWNYNNGIKTFQPLTDVSSIVTLTGTLNNGPTVDIDTSWRLFARVPIGFTPTDNDSFRGEFVLNDMDAAITYQQAFGPTDYNDPAQWAVMKFSSTVVPHTPTIDSTPPTFTYSEGAVTNNSQVINVTMTDAESPTQLTFRVRYATVTGGAAPGDYSTGVTTSYSSNCNSGVQCSMTLSNLAQGTTYYYRIDAKNSVGLVATLATEDSFATPTPPTSGERFISPTGADTNDGLSSGTPVKTWGKAVSLLAAGRTLTVLPGTYSVAAGGNGYLDLKCTTGGTAKCAGGVCPQGNSQQPITIQAQSERTALIDGDGLQDTVVLDGCPYYAVKGLYVKTGDNNNAAATGSGIKILNSNNVTLERNLVRGSNRYKNTFAVWISASPNLTMLENEVLDYFSIGLLLQNNSNQSIVRRNYFNPRGMADLPPPGYATFPTNGGDYGIFVEASSNVVVENNITTNNDFGILVMPASTPSAVNNDVVLGNISYRDNYGLYARNQGNVSTQNLKVRDQVVVESGARGGYGIAFRGGVGNDVKNVSVLDRSPNNSKGIYIDSAPHSGALGSGLQTTCVENALTYNASNGPTVGNGIEVNTSGMAGWGVNFPHSTKNGTQTTSTVTPANYTVDGNISSEANSNVTNEFAFLDMNPGLNYCTVVVPDSAIVKGKGRNGTDIGANVVYRYQTIPTTGTMTPAFQQPLTALWSTTDYKFPCGATVATVNDGTSDTCSTIHKALHVGNADPWRPCVLPYGPLTAYTPPAPSVLPIGVPDPGFGLSEARPTLPSPWTTEQAGYYYIDWANGNDTKTTNPASGPVCAGYAGANVRNAWGYKGCPRKTIPYAVVTGGSPLSDIIGPGSVVVIVGDYKLQHNGAWIIKVNGNSSSFVANTSGPVWFMGETPTSKPTFVLPISVPPANPVDSSMIFTGTYFYLDGINQRIDDPRTTAGGIFISSRSSGGAAGTGVDTHHVVVRNGEFTGNMLARSGLRTAVFGQELNMSTTPTVHDVVFYNNKIHHIGNSENYVNVDQDAHGTTVGSFQSNVWIMDNTFYNLGGDSLQIQDAYCNSDPENPNIVPPATQSNLTTCVTNRTPTQQKRVVDIGRDSHHIYFARNNSQWNRQTGGWAKESRDVIFSQNKTYHSTVKPTSGGYCHGNQYGPDRVWYLFNLCADGEHAFRTSEGASYDKATNKEFYFIGNLIVDTHERRYPHGSPAYTAYRPTNTEDPGHAFNFVDRQNNNLEYFVINNTIYDVDAGLGTTGTNWTSTISDRYHMHNNLFSKFGPPTVVIGGTNNDDGRYINTQPAMQTNDTLKSDYNLIDSDRKSIGVIEYPSICCATGNGSWFGASGEDQNSKVGVAAGMVDPANGNWNLLTTSEAKNAGRTSDLASVVATFKSLYVHANNDIGVDYNGLPRITSGGAAAQGSSVDIGAFEYDE